MVQVGGWRHDTATCTEGAAHAAAMGLWNRRRSRRRAGSDDANVMHANSTIRLSNNQIDDMQPVSLVRPRSTRRCNKSWTRKPRPPETHIGNATHTDKTTDARGPHTTWQRQTQTSGSAAPNDTRPIDNNRRARSAERRAKIPLDRPRWSRNSVVTDLWTDSLLRLRTAVSRTQVQRSTTPSSR